MNATSFRTWMLSSLLLAGVCLGLAAPAAPAADKSAIKHGDRVAIIGDSITEQKLYSKFIETYLLACTPKLDVNVLQFGWSGETLGGLLNRLDNDVIRWQPSVATLCYGMNDGRYAPYSDAVGDLYKKQLTEVVSRLQKCGALVVVGGPGAVDTTSFNKISPSVYNDTLGQLGEIARGVAKEDSLPFADVHGALLDTMAKAKAAYGKEYPVCGNDGVHPHDNGHVVMAYAFLKAAGLDGQIATITMDYEGPATASDGHKILSYTHPGRLELESSRYPFCFFGQDDKDPRSMRGILPFVAFNQDLNRFTLIVTKVPTAKAVVKWDGREKTFTKEQLASGINLAAEFPDNPFCIAFGELMNAVGRKQVFETTLIKNVVTQWPALQKEFGNDAEFAVAWNTVAKRMWEHRDAMEAKLKEQVKPIKHTITVIPVK